MRDPRLEQLADVLVNYSVSVQSGDKVLLSTPAIAAPLSREVYAKALQAGGLPLVMGELPQMEEVLFRHASEEQLQHVPPPVRMAMETYEVIIHIVGDQNTKALSGVDPARMVLRKQGWREIQELYMSRAARGELRWTLCLFPTEAHAQDAEMSLTDFEDFVFAACLPDPADPIGWWQRLHERQEKLVEWLRCKERVRVVAPDTELTLSIAGRTFINSDGTHNMPSGEVFTGPVEDTVEGHVRFTYPAIESGREVEDVQLWFEEGRVVKATAAKGEEFLLKTLDTDEGSRYLGEFAIGTNSGITRFTRNILFDEKIGGSFHVALGAGYPETGSQNRSAIHWDMICDLRQGGTIHVDDELLYRNGEFVPELL
jgi:aminopeptidase